MLDVTRAASVDAPDVLIVQVPPAFPSLVAAAWLKVVCGTRVVVDWHNLTWSMLNPVATSSPGRPPPIPPSSPQTSLTSKALAFLMAPFELLTCFFLCDGHLCVTEAMRDHLIALGVAAKDRTIVVHDRPHPVFTKVARPPRQLKDATLSSLLPNADPALPVIITSTSYTPDEDIGMLIRAL